MKDVLSGAKEEKSDKMDGTLMKRMKNQIRSDNRIEIRLTKINSKRRRGAENSGHQSSSR